MIIRSTLSLILLVLLISSCSKTPTYTNEMKLSDGNWSYDNVFSSSFEIDNENTKYDLLLDLDHSKEFENENIYVNITTHFPNDTIIESKLSLELADKRGKWKGDCGSQNCSLRFYLQQEFKFKEKGSYKLEVAQHTRKEIVQGINQLTLSLFKNSTQE